jgi:glycosyltransferase involved in cell wall biosynthesis
MLVAVTYTRAGTEQLVLDLARRLRADGYPVSMLLSQATELDSLAADGRAADVNIERVGRSFWVGRNALANAWATYRVFRRTRPDIVHFHIPWAPAGPELLTAAWLARVPHRIRTDHNPIVGPMSRGQRLKLRMLDALVEKIVLVSSGNLASHVANGGRPASKCEVVVNGIDPATIEHLSADEQAATRRELGIPGGAVAAVMVGRLEHRKGPLDFVEAAATAATEPNLYFGIIGDGPERAQVERIIEERGLAERVRILGRRDDVRRLLGAFDMYVQPSHYEGMSIAMLEALAAGLPMVTTRVSGVDDVLSREDDAVQVDIGDVGGLAEGMVKLARDPALRARLGSVSHERVLNFTMDRTYESYCELYKELAGTA